MSILVTAFEPFDGDTSNITDNILQEISQDAFADESDVTFLTLPVSRCDALPSLITAIEAHNPDTIICLGQANDRSELSVEKVAINLCCYRIPDNAGEQPTDEPVIADGPAAYFSTLPIDTLLECLAAGGIPASTSYSAGTYVCNSLFYGLMHHIEEESLGVRAGFIHVPRGPLPPSSDAEENLAVMTKAVKLVIKKSLASAD